jgi:hypothetical protein
VEKQLDYVRLSKSNIESLTEQNKLLLCKHLKLNVVREHCLSHPNFELRKISKRLEFVTISDNL